MGAVPADLRPGVRSVGDDVSDLVAVSRQPWWRRLLGLAPRSASVATAAGEQRYTLNDWVMWQMAYAGTTYPLGLGGGLGFRQTLTGDFVEPSANGLDGYAQLYAQNPVVMACMNLRLSVFSQVRFQWQQMVDGRPSKLFGTPDLGILERPWPGGTQQDLLARMIQDADLAGSFYAVRDTPLSRLGGDNQPEILRLRPDWCEWVMRPRLSVSGARIGWQKIGLLYTERGSGSGETPAVFGPEEVTHFAPLPDPLAPWRGMSWLTPLLREIHADALMTAHKGKYFENGATASMVVKYPVEARPDQVKEMRRILENENAGVDNAYRPIHIGGGADVTLVGGDMQQVDFKSVQGGGETRIAAAAGTPAVLVGLSEGMQGSSLNAGNYAMARRRMADATVHPLWQNAAGSLLPMVGGAPPSRFANAGAVRLWYDARDIPFLREDEADAAGIQLSRAQTLRTYVDSGWKPESALAAMLADDEGLLQHSGLFSVQLWSPGAAQGAGGAPGPDGGTASVRDLVEMVQKVYLGVGVVLSADEARELLNKAGAGLTGPAPDTSTPAAPAGGASA